MAVVPTGTADVLLVCGGLRREYRRRDQGGASDVAASAGGEGA